MSDSEDDTSLALLAPDGFPKFYMKKPAGGDPFDYKKPPKQVNMQWRKSEIRKILKKWKILKLLKYAKIPKIPNLAKRYRLQESYETLPENAQKTIRMTAKLVDFWLCRTIFNAFPAIIRITILICVMPKIPHFNEVMCWQKGKWSFSYTKTIIHCLYRSFQLALILRLFVFFDEIIDGPMFHGQPQVMFDEMKDDWVEFFNSFYGKQRIIDFLKCLKPNCGNPYW